MFIYQNKVKNEGNHQLNILCHSWVANRCDGDSALSEHVTKVIPMSKKSGVADGVCGSVVGDSFPKIRQEFLSA